jgi:hypothetical protein
MKQRQAVTAVAAAAALLVLAAEARADAPSLDPFHKASAAGTGIRWQPTRTIGQAAPAPSTPAQSPAAPKPVACTQDDQCPAGTICEDGVCKAFERPIHAVLFRKEGGSTAFIPLYWAHRGNPGYRVFAPIYWHFWSPESRSRIVAPFYWRFEDYITHRVVTVIPPFAHTWQPDAESWAVYPLFYKSTKFGWAAPLLLSLKIANPDKGKAFGLWAGLYFWSRDDKAGKAFDLLLPIFVSTRSTNHAFTYAIPLNFYWRSGKSWHFLGLPFLYTSGHPQGGTTITLLGYGHRSGESRSGSVLWLYWFGREPDGAGYDLGIPLFFWSRHAKGGTLGSPLGYYSRNGRNVRGSALWLYWFGRDADGSAHDVVFPLLWSFRSPESSTTIFGNILHLRRPDWRFTTIFPIYWSGADTAKGSSWHLIPPLFFSRTGEGDRSFTWLTLLGGYRRDDTRDTRTFLWFLPPIIHRRDPSTELDMVLLLYWRHKDLAAQATHYLLGPYYRSDDPTGSTTVLFPLFWYFRDSSNGATAHSLLPLYFRRSSPDESTTAVGVLPLVGLYFRSFTAGGWSAGLYPVAFFGSSAERGHGILFPLFWHFRDRQGSATVAAPFFYRFADRSGTVAGVPPLLFFYGRDRQSHYAFQFPLFWRFVDDRAGSATTVIPPLFYTSRKDGWSAGAFPLLFAGSSQKKGHFVLFPLFWRFRDDEADRTTTVFLNYLHRRHGGETTDALFPLLHYRRGARPGGADETSFTLFPLLHYRRTPEQTLFASPVAIWSRTAERKAGFVLPYFWYESKAVAASGVPPIWFDFTRKESGERTRILGPWVRVDTPTSRARILFPLFGHYEDAQEHGTWVFPAFFTRRTRDQYAVDTLFPLFWYSRWPGNSTTVVGPWYRRAAPDKYNTGFIPFYLYARNQQRRFLITPLFYSSANYKEGTSRTFAALLYYRSTRPDGHNTVLFPLLWAARHGQKSYSVFFPLYWSFSDEKEDSAVTLAGPLFWSHEGTTQRTRGLLPLAWYSRDDKRRTTSTAVLPLFYERHGPTDLSVLTLPFGFSSRPDASWWYATPLIFRKDTVRSTFTMVAPLWFSYFDKASETTTRLVPPLLHFSRSRPDRSLSGWLLLFWRYSSIDSSTTLGLPLLYDIHNYHQSRFTMVAPLFFRYWSKDDDTAYTLLLPLFYRRSSPNDSTTVAFPLFWDWKSPDRRTTVFIPFFFHWRRPTYSANFIFPLIYYSKGLGPAEGTSHLWIIPFWESQVKRPGDYMWEVLLGLFGYERIGRNRFLKIMYYPFELEPVPAAQTAWYTKPPPRAPKQRRYGLDARAW